MKHVCAISKYHVAIIIFNVFPYLVHLVHWNFLLILTNISGNYLFKFEFIEESNHNYLINDIIKSITQ